VSDPIRGPTPGLTPSPSHQLTRVDHPDIVAQTVLEGTEEASEAGIDPGVLSDDALVAAMVEHPTVIQRPIVVKGERAALGRPPEDVLAIL
jgi:arsenate reductase-like glutaredoxin family protein